MNWPINKTFFYDMNSIGKLQGGRDTPLLQMEGPFYHVKISKVKGQKGIIKCVLFLLLPYFCQYLLRSSSQKSSARLIYGIFFCFESQQGSETYDRNDDISVKRIHANEVVDLRLHIGIFFEKYFQYLQFLKKMPSCRRKSTAYFA